MNEYLFCEEQYENILSKLELSFKQIVQSASQFKLQFSNVKNPLVEWRLRIPMFVPSFYIFIENYRRLPSQDEAYAFYLSENKVFFENMQFSEDIMEGIKARAWRTYPSLVRDICFNKYVEENIQGFNVLYSTDLDIKDGIDLMLSKNEKHWAVCLYTNTERAYQGRKAKEKRHKAFSNVEYIELPVDFRGSLKAGQFFLYGENEYNNLIKYLV